MKQQIFYIHGGESFIDYKDFLNRLRTMEIWDLPSETPKEKWTKNFSSELDADFEVFMPAMPNKQNAKYEEWKIWFERHFEYLRDGVILMGCSLGAMFLARYLSENDLPFKTKAVFLMAGAYGLPGFSDKDCGDFLVAPETASVIGKKFLKVVIMHSKDDFLVPYEHALKLKEAMPEAELVIFEDKNHFLIEEFPELIAHIKGLS